MGVLRPDTAVEAMLISSGTDALIPVFGEPGEATRGICGTLPKQEGEGAVRARCPNLERTCWAGVDCG